MSTHGATVRVCRARCHDAGETHGVEGVAAAEAEDGLSWQHGLIADGTVALKGKVRRLTLLRWVDGDGR
eukprot:679842-Prymnesium_polylepis.1